VERPGIVPQRVGFVVLENPFYPAASFYDRSDNERDSAWANSVIAFLKLYNADPFRRPFHTFMIAPIQAMREAMQTDHANALVVFGCEASHARIVKNPLTFPRPTGRWIRGWFRSITPNATQKAATAIATYATAEARALISHFLIADLTKFVGVGLCFPVNPSRKESETLPRNNQFANFVAGNHC